MRNKRFTVSLFTYVQDIKLIFRMYSLVDESIASMKWQFFVSCGNFKFVAGGKEDLAYNSWLCPVLPSIFPSNF